MNETIAWCNDGSIPPDWVQGSGSGNSGESIIIITSKGPVFVAAGDWLIKGGAGDLIPCRAISPTTIT